jgi:flagellar biosynthesis/type III secretory pathway M-ring protein FliF/YscJ
MGSHPVSLKITYSDDLKNSHEITINQTLQVKPQISHIRGDRHGQNTVFGIPLPVIILIIIAIVAFIIVRMIRKRRRDRAEALAASETGEPRADEDDIEKLLDSSDSTEAGPQNIEDRKSSVRKK